MINASMVKKVRKSIKKAGFVIVEETKGKGHYKYKVRKNGITIVGLSSTSNWDGRVAEVAKKCYEVAIAEGWTKVMFTTGTGPIKAQ